MNISTVTKVLFLASLSASALDFSGRVVNLDGTPRSGAMVSLASTGGYTLTDASGKWSLEGAASVLRKESIRPVSAHIVADGGRLRLSWQGKNIMGRASAAASIPEAYAHPASSAARTALVTSDTLEYSFKGYVFLRDTFSESRSEIVRVYDTLAHPAKPLPFGMNLIPAGTFMMGSPATEKGRNTDETQHEASVSAFWMDSTDVTQKQYLALMGVIAHYRITCQSTSCPVEGPTWYDAVLYCNARSRRDGLDTMYSYTSVEGVYGYLTTDLPGLVLRHGVAAPGYRLPTEAEWEYAARGGTTTAYYWGDDQDVFSVREHAWLWSNGAEHAQPVATKPKNAYGLYDMSGNVYQWVGDFYGAYPATATKDYEGPATGDVRVMRGGDSYSVPSDLRSAHRDWRDPWHGFERVGFRCVRSGP